MIKNIIFDFDGVIVDSEILASRAFSKYFNNMGHKFKENDFFQYAGMKTVQVIEILSKKYGITNKKKFTNDIFELVADIYSNDLKLVNGVQKFIMNSNKNHFIGSNSNKDRIIKGLRIVGLSDMFINNKIYSFDMVKKPKPHPDIYLKIINENKLTLNETIIIEDSGIGVKAGSSAGIKVFGITAGKHWHLKRDKNELFDNGAINVFNDYNTLAMSIKEL
tara:strand:+ start:140 stop:799 length:660 start_codon:yes stop_codon:yes gene_type:complete